MKTLTRLILPLMLAMLVFLIYNSNFFQGKIKSGTSMVKTQEATKNATQDIASKLGGHFKLIDRNGQEFNSKNIGKDYKLIYFGFSKCKVVCPTVLTYITEVLNEIEKVDPKINENLATIFISIDKNETSESLQEFYKRFHPSIYMLTGEKNTIATIADMYKVYYEKDQRAKYGSDYDIQHSSIIYLVDKDNQYVTNFSTNDSVEKVITLIKQTMKL